MSPNVVNLLKKKPYLTWWIKDSTKLSPEAIVYAILNYGDFDDVKMLFREMGKAKVKRIFAKQIARSRSSYDKKTKHYFSLYFKKHA